MDSAASVPVGPWGVIVEDELDGQDEVGEAARGGLVGVVFGPGANRSEHLGAEQRAGLLNESLVRHLEVMPARPK